MTGLVPLILATAAFATSPTSFSVTELDTLGGPESYAFGMNDSGQVVGWAHASTSLDCQSNRRPCRVAFVWEQGVMSPLGELSGDEESVARAINDAGLVVGTSESDVIAGSGVFHGVRWSGPMPIALPDLGTGQSFVHDVNANGVVAGWTQDAATSTDRAVLWTRGGLQPIGNTAPLTSSRATGLNDTGLVAGFAWNLFEPNDALLFDSGNWRILGGFDSPWQNAEANDVNNAGVAVGLQAFPSGSWHATVWDRGTATDLGTVGGLDLSELYDINEAGHAVGASYTSSLDRRGVYYDGTQLHDLNDLVPASFGGIIIDAQEINEAGDIAATALIGSTYRAVLLQPAAHVDELTPAEAGTRNEVYLSGLVAGERVWLLGGIASGSTAVPGCTGETVDLASPVVLGSERADLYGRARISLQVPASVSGQSVILQAVQLQSCTVSGAETVPVR